MRNTIAITVLFLVGAIVALGIAFPVYTLGVLISNVGVIHNMLGLCMLACILALVVGCVGLVASELSQTAIDIFKKIYKFAIPVLVAAIFLKLFIPETKENAMLLVGAQVVYDSDTAKSVANSGADILKSSANLLAVKVKQYEAELNTSVEGNVSKVTSATGK